jgi:hypothetical protein
MKRYFSLLPLVVTAIASFLSVSSFLAQAQVPAGPNRPPQVPEGYPRLVHFARCGSVSQALISGSLRV